MSTTDDLGNPKVELSDGSALFALPHDPNAAADSLLRDIGTKTAPETRETPDPTSDEGEQSLDPHTDGGPLRRFNDIKSPLGSVGLESLAKDEDEIAKAISARSDEIYRNDFPVVVPKFQKRCQDCGAEFDDEDIEECTECGSTDLTAPDPAERREIRDRFEHVNKEGQSMRQVGKVTDEDHSRLGVMCWVVRWNYHPAARRITTDFDGERFDVDTSDAKRIAAITWDENVRGDPKRVVPVVDADGRVGGVWWTCPLHRKQGLTNHEQFEDGRQHCTECGCDLREVHYVELEGAQAQDIEKFYFEHEIVMYAGHIPQPHGLDGLSPVHLVWLEQAILHWMDVYAAEYFNPHSERTPGKFIIFHTSNPDDLEDTIDQAKEDMQANPGKGRSFPTILYDRIGAAQEAESKAQVIDVIDNEFLGQSDALRKRYENHIRTVFGVTDVFDSELEDAGGLNNEGLQLEVTDRSIAAAQQDYSDGPYDELLRYWGFEDWRIKFVPPREQDLEEQRQAVKLLREAAEIGLPARMENGEPVIGDGDAEAPAPEVPGGGIPGSEGEPDDMDVPPPGEVDGGESGNRNADDTDEALRLLEDGFKHLVWADVDDVGQKADPTAANHQVDPGTGVGTCENTGKEFEAETFGDIARDCPHCGDPISHIDPEDLDDSGSKALVGQKAEPFWDRDEEMPEFVKQAIRKALQSGAIQRISDELPVGVTRSDVSQFFDDQLSQPQGWSLRSLAELYAERFGVSEAKAIENVRTQTTSVLNTARAEGYREQGDADDRLFKWIGPDDDDNTDACIWLKQQTNPDWGGEPRPLGELEVLVQQANDEFFPDFDGGDYNPHWSCRHTFVEYFD